MPGERPWRLPTVLLRSGYARGTQEVTEVDMEIDRALMSAIAAKVGRDRYEQWFGGHTQVRRDGDVLRIVVPNAFYQSWLQRKFREPIQAACLERWGQALPLEFSVDPDMAKSGGSQHAGDAAGSTDGRDSSNGAPATLSIAPAKKTKPPTQHARRRFERLETFVVGESNQLARSSAQMVVDSPGSLSPLLLHGPTSVGKTHLLEGIWSAFRRSGRNMRTVYLTAEQFTSQFLGALRGGGMPMFRRKYRGMQLLVIDDLQFFAGKPATIVELLHTMDTVLEEGGQLVFASHRSPTGLDELGPELSTRLQAGMSCRVDLPEFATRLGIVRQFAAKYQAELPASVEEFVAGSFHSHARALSGAVNRLRATSLAVGQPITLPMAKDALAELIQANKHSLRLTDIEKAVCATFGLDASSLKSNSRSQQCSHPRMLAMWLARKHTRVALSEIGHFFGHRRHTTVISAQKRVDNLRARSESLKLADRAWNVEEAIHRVEEYLRIG